MTEKTKPPVWFWIVSIVALIWNLMGAMAYVMQAMMTEEALNALPEAERALYENVPAWVTAAFAIAVWGGTLASVLLLMRKGLAYIVFIVSFIGIAVQMVYNLGMSKAAEVYGPGGMVMPIMVIVFGLLLIWFAKSGKTKGWLA